MRTLLPHAAAAAVLATVVAISMPLGLHSAPAAGEVLTATLHAEGAQIYHCKPDGEGKLTWQFVNRWRPCCCRASLSAGTTRGRAGRCTMEVRYPRGSRRTRGQPATTFHSCCWSDGIAGPRHAERRYDHPRLNIAGA
jgi:hypothetical protein